MDGSRTIVSHAQNFEDVILWRALKDVVGGFYIDIGAQDPVIDSVSLAFYEKGWRGIHVEPVPEYAERLRNARPDEQVIEAIIDLRAGRRVFYEISGTGLSTGSRKIAEGHAKSGFAFQKVSFPRLPLSTILDSRGQRDIHWLKIDVEGMERQVIQSWGENPARPWVVVVESTRPLFETPAFTQWEPLLLERGYEFVYFDGINRFYLSKEHEELRDKFGFGPNFFDGFVLTEKSPFCARLNAEMHAAQHRLSESEANAGRLTQAVEQLRAEAATERASFATAAAAWETASAALAGELAAKSNMIAALEARIGDLGAQRETQIAALEARIGDLGAQRETQIAALEARIGDLDAQRMRLEEQLLERDGQAEALVAQRVEFDRQIAALEARIGDLDAQRMRLEEQLLERDGQAEALVAQRAELDRQIAMLNVELFARDETIEAQGARVIELDGTVASLSTRLSEMSAAKEAMHSKLAREKQDQLAAAAAWANEKTEFSNELARLRRTIEDANAWGQAAMAHQAALENQIVEIRGSTSWRVTAPLRLVRRGVHYGIHGSWAWLTLRPGSRPRRVARYAVAAIVERIRMRPGAFGLAKRLSLLFPGLANKLRAAVQSERSSQAWRLSLPPSVEPAKRSLEPDVRRCAVARAARPDISSVPPEATSETFAIIETSMQKWSSGRRLYA